MITNQWYAIPHHESQDWPDCSCKKAESELPCLEIARAS